MMSERKQVKKATLLPRLRFPQFRKAPEWTLGKASDIVDVLQGYGFPERFQGSKEGEFPFYKVSDISTCVDAGGILLDEANNHIDAEVAEELRAKPMPAGATVFAKIGEAIRSNKRAITTRPCLVDNNVAGVKAINGLAHDAFVYYLWCQVPLIEYAGGVVPAVNKSAIEQISICYPQPNEQQKIADCLTSLDEVIAAQGRKVEALKVHKRGLMQQLFPREGETRPRLRFPEFRNAPEWTIVPLGELLEGKPEYGVNAPAVPFSPSLPSYLRITDIDTAGRFASAGKVSVGIDATEDNYLSNGDIALARTGASVGKSYCYREEDGRLVFAGFLIRIRPNRKKTVPTFVSSFLTTQQYWNWVHVTSARSGQPGINGSEYAALPIPIPPLGGKGEELAEQQLIADCLSSLDTQITGESSQLAALKTHKQGLMQQLFPSLEGTK